MMRLRGPGNSQLRQESFHYRRSRKIEQYRRRFVRRPKIEVFSKADARILVVGIACAASREHFNVGVAKRMKAPELNSGARFESAEIKVAPALGLETMGEILFREFESRHQQQHQRKPSRSLGLSPRAKI